RACPPSAAPPPAALHKSAAPRPAPRSPGRSPCHAPARSKASPSSSPALAWGVWQKVARIPAPAGERPREEPSRLQATSASWPGKEGGEMGEFDRSSKWLIEHHGDALLRLAGVEHIVSWRPLPAELVQPGQLPDGVLEAELAGQAEPRLFVLEIATYPEQRLI